jgi:hypothetical protein
MKLENGNRVQWKRGWGLGLQTQVPLNPKFAKGWVLRVWDANDLR